MNAAAAGVLPAVRPAQRWHRRYGLALLGAGIVLAWVTLAVFAPLIAPYSPTDVDVTARLLFGADVHVETVGAIDRAVQTALARYAGRRGGMRLVPSWVPIPAERRYRTAVAALDARMEEIVRVKEV